MTRPTLSVLISNYNHVRFIPEALQAILAQSYRPAEIVIVDDGSTDDSVNVLEGFARTEPGLVRVIRNERNMGLLHNMNRLLELTTADYVYGAACDDKILPGFFERSMGLLERHPAAGLCSTLSGIMDEAGEYRGLVRTPIVCGGDSYVTPVEALAALRRHGSWFMGNTTAYRRAALIEAGGFIPELGPYCDGFISLVLALKHGACFIPEPLAMWRRMNDTYSRRVSMNFDAMINIIETAERLMRSTYREVFPPDYVEEWRRELAFGAATSFVASCTDGRFAGLERLASPRGVVDKAFLWILRTWPALGRVLACPYLFVRLRPKHLWSAWCRRTIYLLDPRLRGVGR